MIEASSTRRGRHGGVIEERGPRAVFVKRASGRAAARDLEREAAILGVLSEVPSVGRLATRVLAVSDGELVLEVVPGGDLNALQAGGIVIESAVGSAVGTAVGTLHRDGSGLVGSASDAIPSAVYSAARAGPSFLRLLSGAGIDLLRVLQGAGGLCAHLDRLAQSRRRDTFVHGDLRFENVMVERYSSSSAAGIRLVDWEFAGRGDAREDVGAFVGGCLDAWLGSIPPIPGLSPAELIGRATWPLAAARGTIGAALRAYADVRGIEDTDALCVNCFEFAAVRLVHLAFEAAAETEDMCVDHVLRLQVAANILADPGGAAAQVIVEDGAGVV